jgi:hypothetical protein
MPYRLRTDGSIVKSEGQKLADSLRDRLAMARRGELPVDNPIMQVTAWKRAGSIEHSKTDVFLQRLQFTGKLGERINAAVSLRDQAEAVKQLTAIEDEVVHLPADVPQVHTALLGVFLGYREKKAYARMKALFDQFPKELKETAVAREQYALALNRLAEQTGQAAEAEDLRRGALSAIDAIPPESITSETFGIRGRIYKGWRDALAKTDKKRPAAMLQAAIEAYEQGFRKDLRDYYPGVNGVTLRLLRGSKQDREALRTLIPVVRFSVDAAPAPKNDQEKYWQAATKLELATAACDWAQARPRLKNLLEVPAEPWMFETTIDNLKRQQKAFAKDQSAVDELQRISTALAGK